MFLFIKNYYFALNNNFKRRKLLASDGHFWDFSGFFKGIFFDY
jgi:hypothetical protein